jgi:hypothetical protein
MPFSAIAWANCRAKLFGLMEKAGAIETTSPFDMLTHHGTGEPPRPAQASFQEAPERRRDAFFMAPPDRPPLNCHVFAQPVWQAA